MQKEQEKFQASTLFEGMTSIRGLLSGQKSGDNDRKILRILYDETRISKIGKEIGFLRHEGERQGFFVEALPHEQIEEITTGNTHGGILAECSDRSIPPLDTSLASKAQFAVMVDGIEDPYNFGYAIRSLYAMGADLLVLSPRNWLSAAGVVARASAGTSEQIPVCTANSEDAVRIFREIGALTVCADADTDALIEDTALPFPLFLIIGGERRGISSSVLHSADKIVRLGYGREFNGALSAASAAAILAYEIARMNRK